MIEDNHIFKGLSMDTHPSRQSKEFLIDAYNIRINNSQDGDLWSITNMRGTEETNIQFQGKYVGHCVIDKYLVVFTVDGSTSYIYRVEYKDNNYIQSILFKEDLGFSADHRIQALGVKENELLYKVYWIDDLHQPRVIIITLPELREVGIAEDYTELKLYQLNQFDFSPTIDVFPSDVAVNKLYGSGVFTPGTIQYAFTYYNKYAQETNIFYTTPLYYISAINRAESADKTVANSFSITINGLDTSYDYLRVYSIHRTSLDATPEVKQLPDIYIRDIKPNDNNIKTVSTIDSGTEGSTVDPTQLLYIGGRAIIANTIASKDNTLFLGDLTLIDNESKIREALEKSRDYWFTINKDEEIIKEIPYNSSSYYFNNRDSLNTSNSAIFKTNETYRIGIQVQLSNGQWLQPVFLKDGIISSTYPSVSLEGNKYQIKIYTKSISCSPESEVILKTIENLKTMGVKNIRACVVYPSAYNREIICQGVLNPTVYNGYSRSRNSPFVQSSWFFRAQKNNYKGSAEQLYGGDIEFRDNYALRSDRYGWEIQSMQGTSDKTIANITDAKNDIQNFYIDSNIVTLNSPDIEFNDNIINYDFTNTKLRIVGYVSLGSVYGDINLDTSTPVLGQDTAGFLHIPVGYNLGTDQQNKNNGGYVSQYSYEDVSLNKDYEATKFVKRYQVYPFQRSGSVNNDVNRPVDKGTRSAVLQTKVISNLKFFDTFKSISNFTIRENKTEVSNLFNIGKPQVFNSNEVSILKLDTQYGNNKVTAIYEGNIDTLVTTKKEYTIRAGNGTNLGANDFSSSKEPVRMKYKSTPHLMFNLTGTSNINSETGEYEFQENQHIILPGSNKTPNISGVINYPDWLFNGNPEDNMTDDFKQESSSDYYGELSVVGLVIDTQEQLIDYIGKGNIYCQYRGNWIVGNAVFEDNGYTIKPVVTGDTAKIFKIHTPTDIIESWYKSHEGLFDGINTTTSDGIVRVDSNVYVTIDKSGTIAKSTINSPAQVQATSTHISVDCIQPKFEDDNANQFLLIGEIVRDVPNKYGGTSDEVLQQQLWFPASDPVPLAANATIQLKYGDTWYQRYDCLKTYPYTNQDENQIVEVGSFMCETYTNLEGRYDKNIDQLSGLYFNPTNFNLINKVYSQQDNFFNYRILEEDFYKINNFSNQITWTLQKGTTDNTDPWTNITLAGILDLDGTYGKVTSLNVLNDNILCFQERALNRIDFNSRVQVQTSDGTPIEIANSKKVDGSRIISTGIGCNDKFSIEVTPNGIYFIDSISKDAYLYTGELKNLSASLGVSSWFKNSKNTVEPYYDSINRELYFKEVDAGSIYYSEDLGQFISRVSSIKAKVLFNFNNKFCSIDRFNSKLWENNIGDYNSFYGIITPSNITFISNDKYTYTKIFDTIEVRGNVFNEDSIDKSITNESPIYSMTVSNNYQYGSNDLDSDSSFIKKKFNIWRLNIPRNKGTRQRIRDQWAKITLSIIPAKFQNSNSKVVINDVSVKYTV